jgi:hypothetical protein
MHDRYCWRLLLTMWTPLEMNWNLNPPTAQRGRLKSQVTRPLMQMNPADDHRLVMASKAYRQQMRSSMMNLTNLTS